MADRQVRVTFQPQGRSISVLAGTKLLEAAARAGLTLETPCGGQGTCGKCRIRVRGPVSPPTAAERQKLSPAELEDGWRLACQSAISGEVRVDVPEASLFAGQHQILAESRTGEVAEVRPAIRKVYFELDEPTLADDVPDLLRLQAKAGDMKVGLELLRRVGPALRQWGFRGTAVLADHHLIDLEAGDTTSRCFGAAFDIGTSTVVGSLVDLRNGDETAVESALNAQVRFGDDVLSRIKHGGTPAGLEELRGAILGTVEELLERLCASAGVAREGIYEITFAGNTTMQHLLCGIDPTQLGQLPFVPAYGRSLMLPAGELGVRIHPRAAAVVFPVIGGFVGGDTVAGMVATRLAERPGPLLMVDIGTNGEIVLAHEGRLWAASTAAGPAFEGARISCGMRATAGAVEKVLFDDDVRLEVIGGTRPIGLCGSALVDAVAELLSSGIVASTGRMCRPAEAPPSLPEAIRRRVVLDGAGQPAFILADPPGPGAPAVAVTQRDIRELQLAAGAIRAGIAVILRQAGLAPADLEKVLLAGGFGSFIRRDKAQRIGLLPPGLDHSRIHYVGNASLAGAKWALLSTDARRRADDLARQTRHVELSQDLNFQAEFAEAMIFPEA